MRPIFWLGCLVLLTACAGSAWQLEKSTRPAQFFGPGWAKDLDAPVYGDGNLAVALNSPLIIAEQQLLAVGDVHGRMRAYDLASGKLRWQVQDKGQQLSAPVYLSAAHLLIYGTAQGRANARDGETGELKYTVNLGSPIVAPGKLYQGRAFFQLGNHQLMCLDALTGKILWSYKRAVPYLMTLQKAADPIVIGHQVLVGQADGSLVALRLEDGSPLWESKLANTGRFVDVDVNPYVAAGKVFVAATGGPLQALDLKTGKVVARAEFAPAVAAVPWQQNRLGATRDGRLILYNDQLIIKQQVQVTKQAITALTIWKDHAVIATDNGQLLAFDLVNFKLAGEFNLGHPYSAVLGNLATDAQHLAVLSSRYHLYVFE